jgi:hypothetical protein
VTPNRARLVPELENIMIIIFSNILFVFIKQYMSLFLLLVTYLVKNTPCIDKTERGSLREMWETFFFSSIFFGMPDVNDSDVIKSVK